MRNLIPKTILAIAALVVVMLALPTEVEAQYRYTFRDSIGTYKVEFTPHDLSNATAADLHRPLIKDTRELRLGTGYNPWTPDGYTSDLSWNPVIFNEGESTIFDPQWYTLSAEYGRWFQDWFYLGANFNWTGGFSTVIDNATFKTVDSYKYNSLSLMPVVRFAWVRRGIVQMYSGVGVGANFAAHDLEMSMGVGYRFNTK